MTSSSESKAAFPKFSARIDSAVRKLAAVERQEVPALFWACTFFFSLLCAYYILRPIRDEMGIAGGIEHLQWMFSATFFSTLAVVPLFGWVTRRFAAKQFLPYVYSFLIVNLLLFYVLFLYGLRHEYAARAFFIWVSVFNLFIVSVFWSLMADIFSNQQAKRLFGVIAAGGTAGALAGPALTALLVLHIGTANLFLLSALFLGWAILCINRLIAWKRSDYTPPTGTEADLHGTAGSSMNDTPMGGSIFAGIRLVLRSSYLAGICLLILLYTALATFLYFHQAHIVHDSIKDPAGRTALFASMDLSVNAIALIIQIFASSRFYKNFGLAWALALAPLILGTGLLALWIVPLLAVVVAVQILQRAGNYAIMRPAREILYVALSPEEKYKAKNFTDTVIYRGGDLSSAWIYAGLQAAGMAASGIAFSGIALAGACVWLSFRLSRRHESLSLFQTS